MKKIVIKLATFATKSYRILVVWKYLRRYKPSLYNLISIVSHKKDKVAIFLRAKQAKGEFIISHPRGLNIYFLTFIEQVKRLLLKKSLVNSFRANKNALCFFFCFNSFINIGQDVFGASFRFATSFIFFRQNDKSIPFFISLFILSQFILVLNRIPSFITYLAKAKASMRYRLGITFKALFVFPRPHRLSISMTRQ